MFHTFEGFAYLAITFTGQIGLTLFCSIPNTNAQMSTLTQDVVSANLTLEQHQYIQEHLGDHSNSQAAVIRHLLDKGIEVEQSDVVFQNPDQLDRLESVIASNYLTVVLVAAYVAFRLGVSYLPDQAVVPVGIILLAFAGIVAFAAMADAINQR
jgi:hypothetical protein